MFKDGIIDLAGRGRRLLSPLRLFLLVLLVGILVGAAADGFRWLLPHTNQLFFGTFHASAQGLSSRAYRLHHPYILVLPALGGLLVGLFLAYVAPAARGHGVAEVLAAMETRGSRIPVQVGAYTALASSVTIGSGGSAGPEGPAIQIGAALASGVGQWLRLAPSELRTILACGGAAGLAALYNAPLAGTLFAVEVLLEEISPQRFALVALAAVAGNVVASNLIVNEPLVRLAATPPPWQSIPLDLGLGLLAGPLGVAFLVLVHRIAEFMGKTPILPWMRPALGGLAVGCIGLFFPRVLGTGDQTIQAAILTRLPLALLIALPLLKLLATALTLGSGGSGGVFTPSLFMGTALGAAYGTVLHALSPALGAPSTYALVGMGTVVASAVNAPLTAIVIVVELTGSPSLVPGSVVAVAASVLVARYLFPESIYTLPLVLRGIQRPPIAPNPLAAVTVGQVLRKSWPTVKPETPVEEILQTSQGSTWTVLPVVDDDGCLDGVIQIADLAQTAGAHTDGEKLKGAAAALAKPPLASAYPDETLHDVLRRPGAAEPQAIPVLARRDQRYLGVLERSTMLRLYSQQPKGEEGT